MASSPTLNTPDRLTLSATAGKVTHINTPKGGKWLIGYSASDWYISAGGSVVADDADKGTDYETKVAGVTHTRFIGSYATTGGWGIAGIANSQVVEITITETPPT